MAETMNICTSCYYARMRKDICGIYCVGAYWKQKNGTCDHWKHWRKKRKTAYQEEAHEE